MNLHEAGMFAIIKGNHAKELGYEEAVGAQCIIQDALSAMCTVAVLAAKDSSVVGSELDICTEDLELQSFYGPGEEKYHDVIIDRSSKLVFYSQDQELIKYIVSVAGRAVRVYPEVKEMHEIQDLISETWKDADILFTYVCLDGKVTNEHAIKWIQLYAEHKATRDKVRQSMDTLADLSAQMKILGMPAAPKSGKVNKTLTELIRRQIEEKADKEYSKPSDNWTKEDKEGLN